MTLRQYRWLQASGCTLTDQWWSFLRVSWWRRPWSSRVNVLKQSVNLVPGHASSLIWQLQHNLTCTETVCQSRAWPRLLPRLTTTTQPHMYWNSGNVTHASPEFRQKPHQYLITQILLFLMPNQKLQWSNCWHKAKNTVGPPSLSTYEQWIFLPWIRRIFAHSLWPNSVDS